MKNFQYPTTKSPGCALNYNNIYNLRLIFTFMPADLNKLNETKSKILDFIKNNGPSLPVHIARAISSSPMFTAAFLSELYAEGRVKISHMRVGSSPLYYLQGQEHQLEKFLEYLNSKEKESLTLLKNEKVLEDETQEPAVRVALRAVKDFAIPLRVSINEQTKTIWKYFTFTDNEIKEIIKEKLSPPPQKHSSLPMSTPAHLPKTETEERKEPERSKQSTIIEKPVEQEEIKQEKPKKKPKSKADPKFPKEVKEYLLSRNIEVLSIIEEKAKEFTAKVRADTLFGKQEYYLIAKDKKKISDIDLTLAHHQAQQEKMIALILAPGELDKKAQEYMKHWNNLIKFERAKL